MDANKILSADVLDIVFEGKNKEYGAYNLRKTYNSRIKIALLITGGAIALLFLINFLAGALNKEDNTVVKITDVSLSEVKKTPPPPPPPKSVLPPPPIQQATVKFTPPVIKQDKEVPPDVKPPDQKKMDSSAISDKTTQGVKAPEAVVAPPVAPPGTGVVSAPNDDNTVFTKVEVDASFPGGQEAWSRYLRKNLNGDVATSNGASPGNYRVIVQFIVSKDGAVSDVKAVSSNGFGMEEEAIRVIKQGPKWTPALQNGHYVNAIRQQPIVFQVTEE